VGQSIPTCGAPQHSNWSRLRREPVRVGADSPRPARFRVAQVASVTSTSTRRLYYRGGQPVSRFPLGGLSGDSGEFPGLERRTRYLPPRQRARRELARLFVKGSGASFFFFFFFFVSFVFFGFFFFIFCFEFHHIAPCWLDVRPPALGADRFPARAPVKGADGAGSLTSLTHPKHEGRGGPLSDETGRVATSSKNRARHGSGLSRSTAGWDSPGSPAGLTFTAGGNQPVSRGRWAKARAARRRAASYGSGGGRTGARVCTTEQRFHLERRGGIALTGAAGVRRRLGYS